MLGNRKVIKIILYSFYAVVILSLILIWYYLWDEKETFYLSQDSIVMLKSREYTIDLYGRTGSKTNDQYVYTSENENVVTVDEDGVIYAVNGGETKVKVKSKYSEKENIMNVEVHDTNLYAIEFENDNIEMNVNEKLKLKLFINGTDEYNLNVDYKSSDDSVVTVDNNGNVEALNSGVAYIDAKIGGTDISTRMKITVIKPGMIIIDNDDTPIETIETDEEGFEEVINNYIGVVSIDVDKLTYNLKVGENEKVNYTIKPINATNKNVVWSSSDSSIATIENGNIIAKKEGTTNIVIETEDGNKTAIITVNVSGVSTNIKVSNISFNKTDVSILKGRTEKLIVDFSPRNATNKKLTWSSNNSNVVSVDSNGNIIGKSIGVATITAISNDGKKIATCNVTVTDSKIDIVSISLDKTKVSIDKGDTTKLKATINPRGATNETLIWTSSNSNIVSVDTNGNITGRNIGTATITVSSNNGKKATSVVTVTGIKIKQIGINRSDTQVVRGASFKVNVTITPSNVENKSVTWSSSNTKVATVDDVGNVKAIDYGTATIKVMTNDGSKKSASFKITVAPYTKMIDLRGKSYTTYYKDIGSIELVNELGPYYRHIQNFAISNIGTNRETIYLSTVQIGSYPASQQLTTGQLNNLNRTIVYKVTKSTINDPSNRPRMYLENTGHGQSFDLEPNSDIMWINAYGKTPTKGGSYWWGGNNGIMRIKWKEVERKGSFTPLVKFQIKDSSGKAYSDPTPAIDKDNNLVAIVTDNKVFIYNYTDFQKGKLTLIYSFKKASQLSNNYSNGKSIYHQGVTFKDGYLYEIRGGIGGTAYIEVFNLLGVSEYYIKVGGAYTTASNREPEGIRIYNNVVYIGSVHEKKIDNMNKKVFDIGYFK